MIAGTPGDVGADPPPVPASRSRLGAWLVVGLLIAFGLRLALLPTYGFLPDIDQYARWTHRLATDLPFGALTGSTCPTCRSWSVSSGPSPGQSPLLAAAPDAGDVVVRVALKVPPILADFAIAVGWRSSCARDAGWPSSSSSRSSCSRQRGT